MTSTQYILLVALFLGFGLLEYILGRAQKFNANAGDNAQDMIGFVLLAAITQPLIFKAVALLGDKFVPQYKGMFADMPWWGMVLCFLVFDDMLQYWWHRLSHVSVLWPLHRAHHSAQYMSARIIYRNNYFYYLFMPAIWMSGVLIYLGMIEVYLVYIVVKLAVITGAHSAVRWDEPLYKIKALKPLMWLVQRTISTPTTHFAHHAMYNNDGIGNYKGNFGNLMFFWDVLFGTAHITQQYPAQVGLREDELFGKEKWWIDLLYPVFWSKREHTVFKPGGKIYDETAELKN
ncbi:MAG: sterol desaturase family protein [Polaromonas sp.]|nr:sterol desaturase family protein [Polaromonas sp.]